MSLAPEKTGIAPCIKAVSTPCIKVVWLETNVHLYVPMYIIHVHVHTMYIHVRYVDIMHETQRALYMYMYIHVLCI